MMNDVRVGNMPDNGVVSDLRLGTHVPAANTDVLPSNGRAAQEEIIPNLGLTLWSENQALIEANEELYALVREMRRREYDAESLLGTYVPVANTEVIPFNGCAAQEEIILNLGLILWSENQALIESNEELCALIREMRRRESDAERLWDDVQDVIQARNNQISTCMHENDRLRYKRM
nr:hypothetical protein [Tanacetum cinerariifolium]